MIATLFAVPEKIHLMRAMQMVLMSIQHIGKVDGDDVGGKS